MVEREKGVETTSCPTCESELKLVEQPDGAVAAEACSTCFTAPEKASKKTASVSREKGTASEEND